MSADSMYFKLNLKMTGFDTILTYILGQKKIFGVEQMHMDIEDRVRVRGFKMDIAV